MPDGKTLACGSHGPLGTKGLEGTAVSLRRTHVWGEFLQVSYGC